VDEGKRVCGVGVKVPAWRYDGTGDSKLKRKKEEAVE
jgi:hypothetical protein